MQCWDNRKKMFSAVGGFKGIGAAFCQLGDLSLRSERLPVIKHQNKIPGGMRSFLSHFWTVAKEVLLPPASRYGSRMRFNLYLLWGIQKQTENTALLGPHK